MLLKRPLRLVLDTYGFALLDLIKLKSEIIKINADEFCAYLKATNCGETFESAFKKIAPKIDSKFFAVSDGANVLRAYVGGRFYEILPEKINTTTFPTGCGDKLLAELIASLYKKNHCDIDDLKSAIHSASEFAKIED